MAAEVDFVQSPEGRQMMQMFMPMLMKTAMAGAKSGTMGQDMMSGTGDFSSFGGGFPWGFGQQQPMSYAQQAMQGLGYGGGQDYGYGGQWDAAFGQYNDGPMGQGISLPGIWGNLFGNYPEWSGANQAKGPGMGYYNPEFQFDPGSPGYGSYDWGDAPGGYDYGFDY